MKCSLKSEVSGVSDMFSSAPINALLLVDENIVATGDDEGTLKVWDMRRGTSFMDLKQHEDYISDITIDQNKRTLLTARSPASRALSLQKKCKLMLDSMMFVTLCFICSGDGTMGVFNIRRRRFELLSEFQNGDLNSVCIMKVSLNIVDQDFTRTVNSKAFVYYNDNKVM